MFLKQNKGEFVMMVFVQVHVFVHVFLNACFCFSYLLSHDPGSTPLWYPSD